MTGGAALRPTEAAPWDRTTTIDSLASRKRGMRQTQAQMAKAPLFTGGPLSALGMRSRNGVRVTRGSAASGAFTGFGPARGPSRPCHPEPRFPARHLHPVRADAPWAPARGANGLHCTPHLRRTAGAVQVSAGGDHPSLASTALARETRARSPQKHPMSPALPFLTASGN